MVALSSLSDELGPPGFLRYAGEHAYKGGDSDDADEDLGWQACEDPHIKGYPLIDEEEEEEEREEDEEDEEDEEEDTDIDDVLSDSEVEEALHQAFEHSEAILSSGISGKALRRDYRAAIASGSLPTPDSSSLPMVAEFTTTLHDIRLQNEIYGGDEAAAEHEEVEASDEAEIEGKSEDELHRLLAEEHSCLIFQFDEDFSSSQRGLGHKSELTAHIHEQLDALLAVKPRADASAEIEDYEDGVDLSGDVEALQEFIDGVDAIYKSINQLEMRFLDSIKLMSDTLLALTDPEQFVMRSNIVGESEELCRDSEDFLETSGWGNYDGPLSAWLSDAQGLELRLRAALDDLSALDTRILGARAAFELEYSALMEIEAEQRSLDAILPRRSFSLLCSEIAQDFRPDETHFTDEAIDMLLAAAESHVVNMFKKANLVAIHSHRTYVKVRDLHVVRSIEEIRD